MTYEQQQPKPGHLHGKDRNPTRRKGKETSLRGQGITGGVDYLRNSSTVQHSRPAFDEDLRGVVRRDGEQIADPDSSKRKKFWL
jgi:hypothetical protein